MKISGIHHVQLCIPADKELEAMKFYKEVLGLKEIPKPKALQKNGGMWFQIGSQELHIGVEDQSFKGKHHPAFLVQGLYELRDHLIVHEVKVQNEVQIPGYIRFSIRDPFGNRIEFIEPE
ncbi:VOC family protein [Fictibacillus phosphorivorans]|uniref:VOC family protein n=1 Tax=Fictibacillus phosphorivorans TaxID=1221500 RepID=UPI00203A57A6|nr:VOC family protein [Fictibacillus phosphorivorans]MCM3719191.1 VOC family protein [Fictibacillus phosphorivorans]MCM3776813.1 VOC family protein [Fictibacillus phosphorivorans]